MQINNGYLVLWFYRKSVNKYEHEIDQVVDVEHLSIHNGLLLAWFVCPGFVTSFFCTLKKIKKEFPKCRVLSGGASST